MDHDARFLPGVAFDAHFSGCIHSATVTFGVDEELGAIFAKCIDASHPLEADGDCACGWVGAVAAVEDA